MPLIRQRAATAHSQGANCQTSQAAGCAQVIQAICLLKTTTCQARGHSHTTPWDGAALPYAQAPQRVRDRDYDKLHLHAARHRTRLPEQPLRHWSRSELASMRAAQQCDPPDPPRTPRNNLNVGVKAAAAVLAP
jgi:hypothetical protein